MRTIPHRSLLPLASAGIIVFAAFAVSAEDLRDEASRMETNTDAELNRAYQQLIRKIQLEHKNDTSRADLIIERLRASQRAWLRYREAQVGFVATYHDIGSASARAAGAASYSAALTRQRIKELNEIPNPF